jgi:chromosome partitioning protein
VFIPTIAFISQRGGAGKTTFAVNLAADAAGHVALVIDTLPQPAASQWASLRSERPPEVIDSAPPNLDRKIEQA